MQLVRSAALSCALLLASAAPAWAWGSYTHAFLAERAFTILAPRAPWLASQRDAFLWGAIAADLDRHAGAAGNCDRHREEIAERLWREGQRGSDQASRAFALGWAMHLASDQARDRLTAAQGPRGAFERALRAADPHDAAALPASLDPLVDWAVDAAIVPLSDGTLLDIYRAGAINAETPEGAPIRALVGKVVGTDDKAYLGYAEAQAALCIGGIDDYLDARATSDGIGRWIGAMRSASVRASLGDLNGALTEAVDLGVARVETLLQASDPPARPVPRRT